MNTYRPVPETGCGMRVMLHVSLWFRERQMVASAVQERHLEGRCKKPGATTAHCTSALHSTLHAAHRDACVYRAQDVWKLRVVQDDVNDLKPKQ